MGKVFDVFPFFNELDILELRLHELDSVVDCFVIVESAEVHGSNNVKPFVLQENFERFADFRHKIVYIKLPQLFPQYTNRQSGWMRENYQRDYPLGPVSKIAAPDDIIIVSDCDEIPRAAVIKHAAPLARIHKLSLDFFYYNVNSFVGPWAYSTIGTLEQYQAAGGFQAPRGKLDMPSPLQYPVIQNAGWHFSYFGGRDRIRFKMENFAHSSDSFVRETLSRGDAQLAADIIARKDLYRRAEMQQFQKHSSTDPRLPQYFLNNKQRFAHFTEEGAQ